MTDKLERCIYKDMRPIGIVLGEGFQDYLLPCLQDITFTLQLSSNSKYVYKEKPNADHAEGFA